MTEEENNCRVEKLIKALEEQQHLIDKILLRLENLEVALEQAKSDGSSAKRGPPPTNSECSRP